MTNIIDTTRPTINGHPVEAGCIVDGHHGQYAIDRLAEFAEHLGWTPADPASDDPRVIRENDDDLDMMIEAADRIEDWLNNHASAASVYWEDGECFIEVATPRSHLEVAYMKGVRFWGSGGVIVYGRNVWGVRHRGTGEFLTWDEFPAVWDNITPPTVIIKGGLLPGTKWVASLGGSA